MILPVKANSTQTDYSQSMACLFRIWLPSNTDRILKMVNLRSSPEHLGFFLSWMQFVQSHPLCADYARLTYPIGDNRSGPIVCDLPK